MPASRRPRLFDGVGDALDRDAAAAARDARGGTFDQRRPVCCGDAPGASPGRLSLSAAPPSSSSARRAAAQERGGVVDRRAGDGGAARHRQWLRGPAASFQAVSAGRISVAIWPGGSRAACTARAASAPTVAAPVEVRTQPDTGRAKPSMSEVSGAS